MISHTNQGFRGILKLLLCAYSKHYFILLEMQAGTGDYPHVYANKNAPLLIPRERTGPDGRLRLFHLMKKLSGFGEHDFTGIGQFYGTPGAAK